jgi:hypothetical protein
VSAHDADAFAEVRVALAPTQYDGLSESSKRALAWASATAQERMGGPSAQAVVEPADVLVGLLLAHPDPGGEARVLLEHFGLTARDLLPEGYPQVRPEALQRWGRNIGLSEPPFISSEGERVIESAQSLKSASGVLELRYLLAGLMDVSSDVRTSLDGRLESAGISLGRVLDAYRRWVNDSGEDLDAMLEREFPQRPADVASYSADRADVGDDLVGVRREVDAFAYLLASKALEPPLAVGLFGDWGSGKSFFMKSMRRRIDALCAQMKDRPQSEVPFWKQIRQVEFNAWEYVQGTLWASLLDHIFSELGGQHIDLVKDRRDGLIADRDAAQEAAAEQESERVRLVEEKQRRRDELATAEQARDEGRRQIREQREELLSDELEKQARKALGEVWGIRGDPAPTGGATDLLAALAEARAEVQRGRALLGPYWSWPRIARASLVALGVPVVAAGLDAIFDLPAAVSVLGGLSVVAPAVTALLRSGTQWSRRTLDDLQAAQDEVEAAVAERTRELEEEVERARRDLEEVGAELERVTSAVAAERIRAARVEQTLEALTPGQVLGEYIQERSRSGDYRRHLGLLARVRKDLRALEKLVHDHNREEAEESADPPPNRIILYIDDLDRCPSSKVVEVLEAVHLLLAFELFVVVVAVDSRWLRFALTDELQALADRGPNAQRATPQDYLEKVFQLPFWVQPLTDGARQALLHGLLEGMVASPDGDAGGHDDGGGVLRVEARERAVIEAMLSRRGAEPQLVARQLQLQSDDLRFIESLAPLLGDTPRRVKRFVNGVQLLLAMPPPLSEFGEPRERAVVAFLAALNVGLPLVAQRLFEAVDAERQGAPSQPLGAVVSQLVGVPADERDRLQTWLEGRDVWQNLLLSRLRARLDIVRRLGFEDHRVRALRLTRSG